MPPRSLKRRCRPKMLNSGMTSAVAAAQSEVRRHQRNERHVLQSRGLAGCEGEIPASGAGHTQSSRSLLPIKGTPRLSSAASRHLTAAAA